MIVFIGFSSVVAFSRLNNWNWVYFGMLSTHMRARIPLIDWRVLMICWQFIYETLLKKKKANLVNNTLSARSVKSLLMANISTRDLVFDGNT